jgi:uncharacterized membrane protein YqiK
MIIGAIVGGVIALLVIGFIVIGIGYISSGSVGILTKKMMGKQMPAGHIIARSGEIGVQASILMPGLYWRMPFIWKFNRVPVTIIPDDSVGLVEAIDGKVLEPGRLLGDSVECNSFQDAKVFLENGGRRGPQVSILKPGIYRINTKIFKITLTKALNVKDNQIGIVTAVDGKSLPPEYVIAPRPTKDHQFYQDGQAFINNEGYRGPQLATLQPGQYYINSLLFKVDLIDKCVVPPGYVGVIVSNVGKELLKGAFSMPSSEGEKVIHDESEILLTDSKEVRGILRDPVAPGTYNLNTIAYKPILVPTSALTIDWASGSQYRIDGSPDIVMPSGSGGHVTIKEPTSSKVEEFYRFSQLEVITIDGFHLQVDVRLVVRIQPNDASYIIARFGSMSNLIEQIVHPLIDSSFRNEAGKEGALKFIGSRTELQKSAFEKAIEAFKPHHVEVQNLLILYIGAPEALLATQSLKQIAVQQQAQYDEQAKAVDKSIQVKEKEARADKQKDVISAKLEIDIKKDLATAAVNEAEGKKQATIKVAEGDAFQVKAVGEATAAAYKAQTESIGEDAVAAIKLAQTIGEGKIKIMPDTYVGGTSIDGLVPAALTNFITKKTKEEKKD